jgi:hypothetical protein
MSLSNAEKRDEKRPFFFFEEKGVTRSGQKTRIAGCDGNGVNEPNEKRTKKNGVVVVGGTIIEPYYYYYYLFLFFFQQLLNHSRTIQRGLAGWS